VCYLFHPLHGQELAVACRPRRENGCVTVIDPDGVQLKIPVWMLLPEAEWHGLAKEAAISGSALLRVCDVLGVESFHDTIVET